MKCLAGISDRYLRALAEKGDKEAREEMVRRGLAYCPVMFKEAQKVSKQKFRLYGFT
jgi:hypothetical protein